MTPAIPDVLAGIVAHKRLELEALRTRETALHTWLSARDQRRNFARALKTSPAVIAEIKKASPSKGVFTEDFRPADIARDYASGGAACLSVLTDERFFQGGWQHFQEARAACQLPMLRKDFTLDPLHVVEAAAYGADAILLIVAILDDCHLRNLREQAEALDMAVLVEVHDAEELDRAIASGASIIGVNNRDLRTFETKLETSLELASKMPSGVIAVSESGIRTRADIELLQSAGYSAFLIGEHLMLADDPAAKLRELRGA